MSKIQQQITAITQEAVRYSGRHPSPHALALHDAASTLKSLRNVVEATDYTAQEKIAILRKLISE